MPILNWLGKEKIVNHDKELPFRVLKPNKKLSVGDDDNLLIQGDNLEALKAIMPFYYGQVKCIYIDPPYNTGNEGWIYNDKVNSAVIKGWLHKAVGAESQDLTRHDKWLCMMYPRLKLLRDLLKDDGVIFISIDDNEVNNLRLIMDEIFGTKNFIASIIVQINPRGRTFDRFVAKTHEYILMYAKDITQDSCVNLVPKEEATLSTYKKSDTRGVYRELELRNRNPVFGRHNRPNLFYPIYVNPKTFDASLTQDATYSVEVLPRNSEGVDGCWTWGRDKVASELASLVGKKVSTGVWRIFRKDYLFSHDGDEVLTKSKAIWLDSAYNNENGKETVRKIFGESPFDFPKSVELIKNCIRLGSNDGDIVLDSFAGSGTTAQAVLEMNKDNDEHRKFVLVELEEKIAQTITASRITKVISGYKGALHEGGTGQGFEYLELNGELFNKDGFINSSVAYADLASYVYYADTKTYLDLQNVEAPYIGTHGKTHYYLLFKGKTKNVLDDSTLKKLQSRPGNKVIYADKCLVDDEELAKQGVIFRQIPYELKKF